MICVFTIYCEQFTVYSFPKLMLRSGVFQSTKRAYLQPPTEILRMTAVFRDLCQCTLGARIEQPAEAHSYGIFARVGWPKIGPATAGPARPVPTTLSNLTEYSLMGWCTYPANETLIHQQASFYQLHHPHSGARRDFHTYMTSQACNMPTYKILATCIERATVL